MFALNGMEKRINMMITSKSRKLNLKELWKSPEWKKISKEYTKDKKCSICGAKSGDTYLDTKGKTRQFGLVVHHIEKFGTTKELDIKKYMNLDNVIVLCNRCHHGLHKNWPICKICGVRFHNPIYPSCWECRDKVNEKK